MTAVETFLPLGFERGNDGFPADLIAGPEILDGPDGDLFAAEIADRIAAVAEARGFPLHTAVAFNALHWGYDPSLKQYADNALDVLSAAGDIVVDGTTKLPALPVGAFCWMGIGGTDPRWVEIIGKDGRPPSGDDGAIDPLWSSKEAGTVVSERWCVDPEMFRFATKKLQDRHEKHWGAWTRAGRLGRHGLVNVDAEYPSTAAANETDLRFYVRWTVEHAGHLLAAGPLGQSLIEAPDASTNSGRQRLTAALAASLATIDAALSRSEQFRRWGDYWLLAEWVDAVDESPNMLFGRADLTSVLSGIAKTSSDGQPTWVTLGPRLADLCHIDDPADDPLRSTRWLRSTLVSARWLGDTLVDQRGKVQTSTGDRYVRFDDLWPWGGTLLSARPPHQASPLWDVPPDEPLWLGSSGSLDLPELEPDDDNEPADEPTSANSAPADEPASSDAEPEPDTPDDGVTSDEIGEQDTATPQDDQDEEPASSDAEPETTAADEVDDDTGQDTGADDEEDVDEEDVDPNDISSCIEFTATLRARDIDNGELPLPERFAWLPARVASGEPVWLKLSHDGLIDDDQRHQRIFNSDGSTLTDIRWPYDFDTGIELYLIGIAGTPTLYATTRPQPDHNGYVHTPADAAAAATSVTLAGLAFDALRRVGRSTYGTRRATARQITEALFGPAHPPVLTDLVTRALDQLVATSRLARPGTEYEATDTAVDPTRQRATPAGQPVRRINVDEIRVHTVAGFRRKLPRGWCASPEKQLEYARIHGHPLPAGFTWVSTFQRGQNRDAWREALRGATDENNTPLTDDVLEDLLDDAFPRSIR